MINKNYFKRVLYSIVAVFFFVLVWGVCSDKSKAYNIDENGQYSMNQEAVNQINKQLDKMLSLRDSTVKATNLKGLQKKYKGLVLEMPYNEALQGANYEDIRVVGINTDQLSEEERGYIEKSQLISLLQSQKNNLDQQVFNIKLDKDSEGNISIKRITLNVAQTTFETVNVDPKPLKVSFSSSPVYQKGTTYITYNNSTVPLFNTKNKGYYLLSVSEKDIHHTNKAGKKHEVSLADSLFLNNQCNTAKLRFGKQSQTHTRTIDICKTSNDSVEIRLIDNINAVVYQSGKKTTLVKGSQNGTCVSISAKEAAKVVVKMNDDDIREIKISPDNPYGEYRPQVGYDIFTTQFVKAVGAANETATLDPVTGKYLADEMKAYRKALGTAYNTMNIDAVVSNGYGEIVAAPYISNAGDKLPPNILESRKPEGFKAYCVGSAFKIPIAAACIAAYPNLAQLNTQGLYYSIDKNTAHFMGKDMKKWGPDERHWTKEGATMTKAIARSDDVFFPAMMFTAINNNSTDLTTSEIFKISERGVIYIPDNDQIVLEEENPFFVNMHSLLRLKLIDAAYTDSTDAPWYYYYRALGRQCSFCPDDACLYLPQFYESNIRSQVAWGLGQGSCRMSTLKLCEIFTTIATKRLIQNSFFKLKEHDKPQAMTGIVKTKNFNPAYNGFLDDWKEAQGMKVQGSTLTPVHKLIEDINENIKDKNNKLVLLAKTGTPDNYKFPGANLYSSKSTPWIDQGLYAMVIMTQKTFNQIKKNEPYDPDKVVTIVVRTTLQKENKLPEKVGSGTARKFWTKDRLATVLKLRGII